MHINAKKMAVSGYFNGSDSFAGVFWRDFGIQYLVFTWPEQRFV